MSTNQNLDFVPFVTVVVASTEDDATATSTSISSSQQHQISCPLARSPQELNETLVALQGGSVIFPTLPFEIFDEHITVVKDEKEFKRENLEKIFSPELKIEEYCLCSHYSPEMINEAVKLGLFSMALRFGKELPEFDLKRNIIRLPSLSSQSPTSTLKLPSGIRKKSKKYAIIIDGGFWDICCQELIAQHERGKSKHSWLNPFLLRSYKTIHSNPQKYETNLHCITVVHASMVPELIAAREAQKNATNAEDQEKAKQAFEVVAKKAFCAGELGTTCGSTYCSLSGGFTVDGTGSIQLGCLSALLIQLGYRIWDLGQGMKYKETMLGSIDIPRKEWVEIACENAARDPDVKKLASLDGYVVRCDSLIKGTKYFDDVKKN